MQARCISEVKWVQNVNSFSPFSFYRSERDKKLTIYPPCIFSIIAWSNSRCDFSLRHIYIYIHVTRIRKLIGSNRAKTKLEFFFLLRIIAQGIISLYFTLALFVIFEQDELEKEETSVLYAKTIIARSLELTLDSFVESKKKAAQDIYIYIPRRRGRISRADRTLHLQKSEVDRRGKGVNAR